jgi:hypothetical protein
MFPAIKTPRHPIPVTALDELTVIELDVVCVGLVDVDCVGDDVCVFEPVILGVAEQEPATDKPEIKQPS